jgi:hypothetical protein
VTAQEVSRGVGTINFKAQVRAAVLGSEAHVVEHGAEIEQFRVVAEGLAFTSQGGPQVDAPAVTIEQVGLSISDQLCCCIG